MPETANSTTLRPDDVLGIRNVLLEAIPCLSFVQGTAGCILNDHHRNPTAALHTSPHAPDLARTVSQAWKLRDEFVGIFRGRVIAEDATLDKHSQKRVVEFEFLCARAAQDAGGFSARDRRVRVRKDGVKTIDRPRTDTSACSAVMYDLLHFARGSHPTWWTGPINDPIVQSMAINALYEFVGAGWARPADAVDDPGIRDKVIDELARVYRMVTDVERPPSPNTPNEAGVSGKGAKWTQTPGGETEQPNHSADFTFVNWYGTKYTFALGVQSSAVKALWDEWKKSGLGLHQETIRDAVDPERHPNSAFRMDKVFRNNPAFRTMIQSAGDGKYKLVPPENEKVAPFKTKKAAKTPANTQRRPR